MLQVFVPPTEVFEIPVKPPTERLLESTNPVGEVTGKATRSKDGELLTEMDGFPHPRKGCAYKEALVANAKVKRRTLTAFAPFAHKAMLLPALGFLISPFKWKIAFFEQFLLNYLREVDSIYFECERIPYYKKEFYNNCSKAVWDLIEVFLVEIGINQDIAWRFGRVFATQLEFEDAYRIRIEDPFAEFTKEEILKNPRQFVTKFIQIVKERDVDCNVETNEEIPGITYKKFEAFGLLLKATLLYPKVRKAFIKAFEKVNFEWLKPDEIEIFWNLPRHDYKFQGRDFRQRFEEYVDIVAIYTQNLYKADAIEVRYPNASRYELRPLYKTGNPNEYSYEKLATI